MFSGFGSNNSTFGGSAFPSSTANTSVFGQQTQPAAATSSLFGGGFGQQPKPPTFGSSFGSPQASSIFGQQNRVSTPTAGGLFSGQTAAVSPFSAQGQSQTVAGTSVPFTPINGTDTMMKNGTASPISTRHQCITCMKEYENKSLEELRLEDYQLNRKGPQNQVSLFGAAQPQQSSLFSGMGATATSTPFGQTSTFGTSTNTGTGLFSSISQQKPAGSFFSNPAATTSAFGTNSAFSFSNPTSQTASAFGAPNNATSTGVGGMGGTSSFSFGQPQTQTQTGSLFGQKPMTSAATTTGFGGFGTSAFANNTSTANKPTLGFGFGTNTTPSFGAPATSTTFGTGSGSLFGSQAQTQNKPFSFATPFTSQAQPAQTGFGAPASSAFNFNTTTTSAPSVGFGASTNTFGSLGGGTTNTFATPSFGAPQSNFGFGLNTSTATGGFSSFTPSTSFTQQPLMQQQQQQTPSGNVSFATTPYKDSPLFYNLIANRDLENMIKPTSPAAQRAFKEASRRRTSTSLSFSNSSALNRNHSFPTTNNHSFNKSIFDGFEDDDKNVAFDILSPKTSVKKLELKTFKHATSPSHRHSISFAPSNRFSQSLIENGLNDSINSELNLSRGCNVSFGGGDMPNSSSETSSPPRLADNDNLQEREAPTTSQLKRFSDADRSIALNGSADKVGCRVINTRPGYYMQPSVQEMDKMVDEMGNCFVKGLTIGRQNHGEIRFLDAVNVAGTNVDDIVHFRHKEVVVYPDDNNKPPLGEGLNCPAVVSLERVWPIDKVTKDPIKHASKLQSMGYEDMLKRACQRLGAEFVSYIPENGIWSFKVQHFSKYSCEVEETDEHAQADNLQPQILGQTKGLGGISLQANQTKLLHQQASFSKPGLSTDDRSWMSFMGDGAGDMEARPLMKSRIQGQSTPFVSMMMGDENIEFAGGDVEHNPLTPSESNDSDSDSLAHEMRGGRGQGFESVLRPKSESSKVQMMRSALLDDPDHEEYMDFQEILSPPKKSRPSSTKLKETTNQTVDFKISDLNLSLASKTQQKPGPPVASFVNLAIINEQDEFTTKDMFTTNYVTSIQKRSPITVHTLREDIFTNLPVIKAKPMPRVSFGPHGTFININNIGKKEFQVEINGVSSYMAQLSDSEPVGLRVLEAQLEKHFMHQRPRIPLQIDVIWELRLKNTNEKTKKNVSDTWKAEAMMWELCHILWPMHEENTPLSLLDMDSAIDQRDKVSEWLAKFCNILFPDQLEKDAAKSILGLMKMGNREAACSLAVKLRNYHLALCIAQSPLARVPASNCEEQLAVWERDDALQFVSDEIKTIYRLCAGTPILDHIDLINMTTSEWLQHFAIYLWYCCPPHVPVYEAVTSFQRLLKSQLVMEGNWPEDELNKILFPSQVDSSLSNLCVQLLKLYSFAGYPLQNVLDPRTYSPDCLDYKLSWLLMINLEEFGYICSIELFTSITSCFSNQLEQLGLYTWALYVMSYLPKTLDSIAYTTQIVERNLGTWADNGDEQLLLENQLISPDVLQTTRAIRTEMENRRSDK